MTMFIFAFCNAGFIATQSYQTPRSVVREKRFHPNNDKSCFKGHTERVVEKTICYSKDPRDFGYVAENIPCQHACPASTNIPGYIRCISEKRYGRSYELNRMYNVFPGVLGRICFQCVSMAIAAP